MKRASDNGYLAVFKGKSARNFILSLKSLQFKQRQLV